VHTIDEPLLEKVRERFALVDKCPQQGKRIFFENAGGALTLKSVLQTSTRYAAIPDNQGRDNRGSLELIDVIDTAKDDMRIFMNARGGQFFVGESGTELLFRLVMNACLAADNGGTVLGSTLEHPATRSACDRWSRIGGHNHVLVEHDDATGTVTPESYASQVTDNTVVATILHTSPVTGMGVDVAQCAKAIRAVSPACIIVVDGIQHAAHGGIDLQSYNVDGYVISPYKVFSRHGFGVAWVSDALSAVPHNNLLGGPEDNWEMGTRDTGAYATLSDLVSYFDWLGGQVLLGQVGQSVNRRGRLCAAADAVKRHEKALTETLLHGDENLPGLASQDNVIIIGGAENPAREGLVSFVVTNVPSVDVVSKLNDEGIRTHVRKADHYSGNILNPLGLDSCIRVSMCHYNTVQEVEKLLVVMNHMNS